MEGMTQTQIVDGDHSFIHILQILTAGQ